jgi:CBS domain-containing protein
MPRTMAALLHRGVPLLREDTPVGAGVGHVVESGFPALPVVDGDDCLVGIFGEREFITAIFPGYVKSSATPRSSRSSADFFIPRSCAAWEACGACAC